jgi:hypothetical protein
VELLLAQGLVHQYPEVQALPQEVQAMPQEQLLVVEIAQITQLYGRQWEQQTHYY